MSVSLYAHQLQLFSLQPPGIFTQLALILRPLFSPELKLSKCSSYLRCLIFLLVPVARCSPTRPEPNDLITHGVGFGMFAP
jgi:hypothetical protein